MAKPLLPLSVPFSNARDFMMAAASYGLAGETDRAKGAIAQLTNLVPDFSAAAVEENFLYCQPEDLSRLAMGLRAAWLQG